MPDKAQAITFEQKPLLKIDNFEQMTLEERLTLIDNIKANILQAVSRTFIRV